MKKSKVICWTIGGLMILAAIIFIIIAMNHPEMSFRAPAWVTQVGFGVYLGLVLIVFFIPVFKESSGLRRAAILIEAVAVACLTMAILGLGRTESGSAGWALPGALAMNIVAGVLNMAANKKEKK